MNDFGKGLCECGNRLWQSMTEKYKYAQIVKTGRDTLAWQWPCKVCGLVHHEAIQVQMHYPPLRVTSVGPDD